jgi:8-hydroxy-5-deazaflavin:NADPH oxidoreductase
VVKALNTMNAYLMADPTVLIAGSYTDANTRVAELLRSFGWSDVVDLGDITTAQGTEVYLPLWARIWGVTQNPTFTTKVAR